MAVAFVQSAPRGIDRVLLAWLTQTFMPLDPSGIVIPTLTVTTLNIGAADTSITRLSAGVIQVEGVTIATAANTLGFFAATTSAQLAAVISDETGSGALVFATSPTLVTPILGTPQSGNLSNCTAYAVGALAGLGANVATFLGTPSSANLAAALTDETGTGAAVFANTPTLVTPVLGAATGTSVNLAGNCRAATFNVGATPGATGGPFTTITSITVEAGIVTAITGS